MPAVRMKATSWVPVPPAAVMKATQSRQIEGRVFVAAGSEVDVSKIDKQKLGRMMEKSYPDFVDLNVVVEGGKNTRVYEAKEGAKVPVPRSRGREHKGGE